MRVSNIERLDDIHSTLVTIAAEGGVAEVLQTLASVICCIPELDKPENDAQFWQQTVLNLNILAETLQENADADLQELSFDSELTDDLVDFYDDDN